jgi:hypothetical protein
MKWGGGFHACYLVWRKVLSGPLARWELCSKSQVMWPVIYDCNGNGLYYKTMILANFAFAGRVNVDQKVLLYGILQTEAYLCNCKTFTVQATGWNTRWCPRLPGILPLGMRHHIKAVNDKNTTSISENCQAFCNIIFPGVTLTKIFSVITNG